MFGLFGGLGSDPDKERSPPSAPVSLDFPIYNLPEPTEEDAESALKDLHNALASIKRPQDITASRFRAFNLKVESELPASCIVRHDTTTSVPPLPWEDTSGEEDGQPALMSNENRYPDKERFEALKSELLLDNDDAFREVTRMPPREGRQRVRIAQTRKFWTGFERMAQYWDTSLDNYFERPAMPKPEEKDDQVQTDGDETKEKHTSMDVDQPTAQANGNDANDTRPPVTRYTGRRIGAGHEMPEDAREETVRAFVEMAAWPFGCQVSVPTISPRLAVKTLLFPVRMTFEAGRSPKDRSLARSGVLEGPVFVGQCRPETAFRAHDENPGSGIGEISDLFREVGAMLLAAQERAREGATEVRPGEGKWWTTAPRWGGATNDGPEGEHNTDSDQDSSGSHGKEKPHKRSKYDHPFLAMRRPRRISNAERWKLVQPGPSLWERRMRYMQIGKTKDELYDDIYMVSSINHHISILHLRVHRRYLEIVTTGESDCPTDSDDDQPWYVLKLRRTKWYDLFEANDRLEAFEGVWRIFHYSLRRV